MSNAKQEFKKKILLSLIILMAIISMVGLVYVTETIAQTPGTGQEMTTERAEVIKFGVIAAAIAVGFGALAAGYAIAHVGAAAIGAIAEKPEIAGQALIFIALAEGLIIFGFITALMILGKV